MSLQNKPCDATDQPMKRKNPYEKWDWSNIAVMSPNS